MAWIINHTDRIACLTIISYPIIFLSRQDAAPTNFRETNNRILQILKIVGVASSHESYAANLYLYIVIQIKLVGMWTQFDVVDFIFGFVFNPHVDGILGEHIAS